MQEKKIPTLAEATDELERHRQQASPPIEESPVGTASSYLLKYTLDGEVLVEVAGEDLKEHPLKTVILLPVPDMFKETHMSEMKMFHSLVRTIKKSYPTRAVPVTRKELFRSGATTKLIQQLCEMGYLKEALVDFVTKEGRSTGVRSCFFYTPQGRALIRERLDPEYAKTDYN